MFALYKQTYCALTVVDLTTKAEGKTMVEITYPDGINYNELVEVDRSKRINCRMFRQEEVDTFNTIARNCGFGTGASLLNTLLHTVKVGGKVTFK